MAVLREAGGAPEHLVRMTMYVTDKREYLDALAEVGAAWRRQRRRLLPGGMALVQVGGRCSRTRRRSRIEATAVLA